MTSGQRPNVLPTVYAVAVFAAFTATSVLAQQPDDVTFAAWVGLARVKQDVGDVNAAAAAWRAAERIRPLTTALQEELFWVLSEVRPDEARATARLILTAEPKADKIREKAIHLASEAGDESEIEALATAGLAQGVSARWSRALGLSATRRRDSNRAVQWFRATTAAPDHAVTDVVLLAITLSAAGDDRAAVDVWRSLAPDVWRQNPEWARSRLHAYVKAAWSPETKAAADAWMQSHPEDDDVIRHLVVAAMQRRGDYTTAFAYALDSAEDLEWMRIRARLAEYARRPDIARTMRHALAARSDATIEDRLSTAEWFRAAGEESEALTIARALAARPARCSDEVISLLFRMQSVDALDELSAALRKYPQHCSGYETWVRGLVGKLVAMERFAEGAGFIEPLAVLTRASEDLETAGQLRLWNGDASGAVEVLFPLATDGLVSQSGLDSAIDALRLVGRSGDAWAFARRRLEDPMLAPTRAIDLAELAIDNGAASVAQDIARRVAEGSLTLRPRAYSVVAQALLLTQDPRGAFDMLEMIEPGALDRRGRVALEHAQLMLARGYLTESEPVRAVEVLTRYPGLTLSDASQLLLARAYVDAGQLEDADRAYELLTTRGGVTADVFVAWSRLKPEGTARLSILNEGHHRFSNDRALTLELAIALQQTGDLERAAAFARVVLASDEGEPAAWRIVIDHVRAQPSTFDVHYLARVATVFTEELPIVIELAERLGAAGASEAASTTALRWLSAIDAPSSDQHVARELARARILNSRGHVLAALEIVSALANDSQASAEVLRLHAQLLGWNGHHAQSLKTYEAYLAAMPDDLGARREQARVAGWAQQFERARRLYAAIDERYPSDTAARAEAEAKRFFFASRWRDAERAYERWLDVEPLNEEAAFEYAETLVAQGRISEARDVYDRLSGRSRPHEMAHLASRLLDERSNASGTVNGVFVSSSGYEGQRLLEWSEAAGGVSLPMWGDARQTLELSGSSLTFSNRALRLPAYAGRASASMAYSWGAIDGALSATRGARDLANWQGHATASVQVRHNLGVRVGLERTALLENLSTVRDGLASWGPTLSLAFTSPDTEVAMSARASWIARNVERAAGVTVRQRVRRGTDEVRIVGGVNQITWAESDLRFFSPESFTRADAGLEWMKWIRLPKFRMDRRSSLKLRYQAGVDSRGEIYHQPFAQLSLEHRRMAIETEASWIASRVYRSLTLHLGVRLGG